MTVVETFAASQEGVKSLFRDRTMLAKTSPEPSCETPHAVIQLGCRHYEALAQYCIAYSRPTVKFCGIRRPLPASVAKFENSPSWIVRWRQSAAFSRALSVFLVLAKLLKNPMSSCSMLHLTMGDLANSILFISIR